MSHPAVVAWLSPDPIGDGSSQPDQYESEYNIRTDICQSVNGLAAAQQVDCVIPKRGEGCKPTQNADKYKRPGFRRKSTACLSKLREEADDKTSDQINRERAVGKVDAFAGSLRPCAQHITKDGAKCSAKGNEEYGID